MTHLDQRPLLRSRTLLGVARRPPRCRPEQLFYSVSAVYASGQIEIGRGAHAHCHSAQARLANNFELSLCPRHRPRSDLLQIPRQLRSLHSPLFAYYYQLALRYTSHKTQKRSTRRVPSTRYRRSGYRNCMGFLQVRSCRLEEACDNSQGRAPSTEHVYRRAPWGIHWRSRQTRR